MNDALGGDRTAPQAVEVLESTPMDLGAGSSNGRGGGVRAGEADDLMPCFEQIADDGGTDVSGCSGHEDTHVSRSSLVGSLHCSPCSRRNRGVVTVQLFD
jgi:hypothetical protein